MAVGVPVVGTKNERSAASTTSTPAYPAVTAADLLLGVGVSGAAVNSVFDETTNGSTPIVPTFTPDGQIAGTGNTAAPMVYCAHAIAAGSESGAQTWHHTNVITSMAILGISGQDPTTPFDPNVNGGAPTLIDKTSTDSAIPIPSVTVTRDGSLLLYVMSGNATTSTATPPGGWTELVDRTLASSRNWHIAYRANVPAGATGTASGTWSGSQKCVGFLYVIQPPATFGPPFSSPASRLLPILAR